MLILQALFLWLIVSTLMIGGAMLFHRLFPEETPWFGFIIPPLALVVLLNFIEHLVALPVLLYLLPAFLLATIWMMVSGKHFKQPLILPTAIFLAAFAFTFAVRCLRPDIDFTSDGISDLNMINNFSQGKTIPPPDTWMPPYHFEWYYDLQHYAASVMERLLAVKIGVAYNVAHALLSALICVAGAGAAHRLSNGSLWITLAVPFLIESAATGSSAYLYLTAHRSDPDLWMAADPSDMMLHPPDANPIWKWLFNDLPAGLSQMSPDDISKHQTLRLQVPGFWTWRSEYHANASGHLLSALSILILAELVFVRKTIWPWVLGRHHAALGGNRQRMGPAADHSALLGHSSRRSFLRSTPRFGPHRINHILRRVDAALAGVLQRDFIAAGAADYVDRSAGSRAAGRISSPVVAHYPPLDLRLSLLPEPLVRRALDAVRHPDHAHRDRICNHRHPLQHN